MDEWENKMKRLKDLTKMEYDSNAHNVSHERSGRSFLLHGSRQGANLANDVRKCAKRQLISFSGQEKRAEFCTKEMPSFDRKCLVFC